MAAGVFKLAQRVKEQAGPGSDPGAMERLLLDILANEHPYRLPGQVGAASSLPQFLQPGAGGHCELFASATALVLRCLGIPCRLATGYRTDEIDASGRLVARSLHAHAWVEVLDPNLGWRIVDPTPASADLNEVGWLARMQQACQSLWTGLIRFGPQQRKALFGAAGRWLWTPWPVLASIGVVLTWWWRRRRVVADPTLRRYRRRSRRRHPAETPREFLSRMGSEPLARATAAHEASRYAARAP
jgi:hypothetical protein